ncbi:hypothetical protein TRAPUB_9376 [Trametes pubescens]|uniref:Uncharacterized protein n=1 Tax=Trametes pubescens TaxID=154538 RepID=A0A1M2W2P9_TRAPU|nr:hypothetical protein TRAPUB_9376 [Trametes pubescens]
MSPAQVYLEPSTSSHFNLDRQRESPNALQRSIYIIVVVACLILIPVCIGVGAWLYRARSRKAAARAASGNTTSSRNTIETRATSPTASTAGLISPDDSVLHEPTAFYASRMVRSRDSQVGHPSAEAV